MLIKVLALIWCRIFLFSSELYKILNIKTHRIIILPVVLYVFESWSLTLTEERRLRLFENTVLRRIFGVMTDGEKGQCRKVQRKELNDL